MDLWSLDAKQTHTQKRAHLTDLKHGRYNEHCPLGQYKTGLVYSFINYHLIEKQCSH